MKLIKINSDHYIIVDDSEIKEGDWVVTKENTVHQVDYVDAYTKINDWKKITHSTFSSVIDLYKPNTPLILNLSEVKELLGEVDVEKRIQDILNAETPQEMDVMLLEATKHGFKYGYNQALEDNKDRKYTEEDVIAIVEKSRVTGLTAEYLIQSLQPTTSWNVEFVDGKLKLI